MSDTRLVLEIDEVAVDLGDDHRAEVPEVLREALRLLAEKLRRGPAFTPPRGELSIERVELTGRTAEALAEALYARIAREGA